MKNLRYITGGLVTSVVLMFASCDDFLDVNVNPNNPTSAPINQVLTSVTVNTGFRNGSDMHRYTSLIAQQFSGQGADGTQNREYARYLIQPTDLNNMYNTLFAGVLADTEYIIKNSEGSPHYTGVAKILKAYTYSQSVDMWGDLPYTEALKGVENLQPKVDKDEAIYADLFRLINEGIAEIKATASNLTPGTNETIYRGDKVKWEKFANTLKLRLYLHYSEKDPAFAKTQMDALIGSGAPFISANADNFQMAFTDAPSAQNPIHQFEVSRTDQYFPNKFLVDLMNSGADPRRKLYFTDIPFGSGLYKGSQATETQSFAYSRPHTYLRGQLKTPLIANAAGNIVSNATNNNAYSGTAPIRMLTFAEYNFIRAEHALRFGAGAAAALPFFQAGIRASMADAGITVAEQDAYILTNGILAGTAANNLKRIIEEKYIANFGVALEPWTDWRRTGFPGILPVPAPTASVNFIPRSLFYPEAETLSNPNLKQKAGMNVRVFWDTRP